MLGSGGSWADASSGGSVENYRANVESIALSAVNKSIIFGTPMNAAAYYVHAYFVNLTDLTPIEQKVKVSAQADAGVTFFWDTPLDTANYLLYWFAVEVNA